MVDLLIKICYNIDYLGVKLNMMTAKEYAKVMYEQIRDRLREEGITKYKSVTLNADRTEYEVRLDNGTTCVLPSGIKIVEE